MKIVQFIAENSLTGGPRHVLDLSAGLVLRGHQVILIWPKGVLVPNKSVQVIDFKSTDRRGQIKELKEILIEIKNQDPCLRGDDTTSVVFHCHGVRGGLVGRLAARGLKIPVVYTEHLWTSDFHLKNLLREKLQLAILKKLDKYTTKTIAVSNAVKDFLIEKKISPAGKIAVVYNGLPIIHNTRYIIQSPVIGSMGVDNYIKDFATLRKAFEIVKTEFPATGLKIVHDEKKLSDFYESLTIYVQPSLSESFGIAAAEAMSYGVPVVATNAGGLKELIENGKNGILVKPRDVNALAAAIIKLLKDKNLSRTMGERGRERIARDFSLEKMIKETEEVYESIS